MPGENNIKSVVARKLRGLPPAIEEAQIVPGERCRDCGGQTAEKGTQAQQAGLCGDCASWRRRNGHTTQERLPTGD